MKINFAARVDIGPKATNDDRVLMAGQVLGVTSCSAVADAPVTVAVCDGCGGYAGGGIAAETVLNLLCAADAGALGTEDELAELLQRCQSAVMDKKAQMPQYEAMCTTVAGCVFHEDRTLIFHSGDSRVYRFDRWGLTAMTRDHSVVRELIDMGEIKPEDVPTHPRRNVITRCIGVPCLPPDLYLSQNPIAVGEKYLFCSDGLWETVTDMQISEVLGSDMTLGEMADALVDMAIEQGAYDNISACICAVEGETASVERKPFVLD